MAPQNESRPPAMESGPDHSDYLATKIPTSRDEEKPRRTLGLARPSLRSAKPDSPRERPAWAVIWSAWHAQSGCRHRPTAEAIKRAMQVILGGSV
jgi:hypothetical protein